MLYYLILAVMLFFAILFAHGSMEGTDMKKGFLVRWHWFRFNWYWNRMKAIADRSCLTHRGLMETNARYREYSFRYDESKSFLVMNNEYVTAVSIIERKRRPA